MIQYSFLQESLSFKVTIKKTDFGYVHYYDCKEGRFALYYYNDDMTKLFLSNVDIWREYQGNGFGNELIKKSISESQKLSDKFGFKELFLNCKKSSFVHQWYKKFGFKDYKQKEDNSDYIWMIKTL